MIDIEKVQNATKFIECLANGIHPITGEVLKETVFDEPEIIKGLFFVKEVLQENVKRPLKTKKEDFVIVDNLQLLSQN